MSRKSNLILAVFLYFLVLGIAVYILPKILVFALKTEYPIASIASESMQPVLNRGDIVFIKGIEGKEDINIGDVVVYKSENGFIIHRVIEKGTDTAIVKGDANEEPDPPVEYSQIVGKAIAFNGDPIRIPYLGNLSLMLKGD